MTDLDDAIARLVEMQEDVISGSDAVPFATYAQESGGKFWTNDIVDFQVEVVSEELQRITYTASMTYHGAEATEGFEGQPEQSVQTIIPTVIQYFSKHRQLKRTNADTPITNLDPRGAQITGGRVDRGLTDSVGQRLFGIQFRLELPMFQDTEQSVF